jgi:mycofactocin system glycosyltransferase
MNIRLVPDKQWFRSKKGNGVLAGSPLTYFGVTDAGIKILDAIETNSELPPNHAQLTDRLLATGGVHPLLKHSANPSDITVVIPAFVTNEYAHAILTELVAGLSGLSIIVVDDASPFTVTLPGTHVIRLEENSGPSVARNTGIAAVTTRLVACIDADAVVTTKQILSLGAYLDDSRVGLVAPRIICTPDRTFLNEFESHHSPLDLGETQALIRPMSRVSYVPAAVIVCNAESLRTVGLFDESMRLGEDVDIVWRMIVAGTWCRYVPAIECVHRSRQSIRGMLKQRFDYGTSAASLDQRHPRAATPLRAHALLLAAASALLMGYIYLAFVLGVLTMAYFVVSLRSTSLPVKVRTQLAWKGLASTTRLLADAVMRAWWPIFFVASLVSIRLGAMLTFSALVPPIVGLVRHKPGHPIRYLVMCVLEDVAYGTGVWVGALRARSLRCLLPVITVRRSVVR